MTMSEIVTNPTANEELRARLTELMKIETDMSALEKKQLISKSLRQLPYPSFVALLIRSGPLVELQQRTYVSSSALTSTRRSTHRPCT